jgi:hypothetical protein
MSDPVFVDEANAPSLAWILSRMLLDATPLSLLLEPAFDLLEPKVCDPPPRCVRPVFTLSRFLVAIVGMALCVEC